MTAVLNNKKQISLKLEAPLYSLLEQQADENGEPLNDLISRLLAEAVDNWCEYCETVHRLAADDDEPVRLCVK